MNGHEPRAFPSRVASTDVAVAGGGKRAIDLPFAQISDAMSFSLTPLVASTIPRPDAPGYAALKAGLLDSANALLDSLPALSTLGDKRQTGPAWRKRSTQNKRTPSPTYCYDSTSLATEGFKFHTRISRHAGSSLLFDGFAHGLLKDHSINESRYIESCSEAKLIEIIEPGVLEIWQMSCEFSLRDGWADENRQAAAADVESRFFDPHSHDPDDCRPGSDDREIFSGNLYPLRSPRRARAQGLRPSALREHRGHQGGRERGCVEVGAAEPGTGADGA